MKLFEFANLYNRSISTQFNGECFKQIISLGESEGNVTTSVRVNDGLILEFNWRFRTLLPSRSKAKLNIIDFIPGKAGDKSP